MDKFQQAARDNDLTNSIAEARDLLTPIITSEIERQHCVGNQAAYGGKPGYRKTKLTDATKIAKQVEILLNKAINKFEDEPR